MSKKLEDFYVGNGDRSSDLGEFPPSLARQEFADECDINVIMARYEKTGVITHVADRAPIYVDLTVVPSDLMTAMSVLNTAEEGFMTLPAKIRREFDNDPMKFVEFATKAENLDQMRTWGLAPPAPAEVEQPSIAPAQPAPPVEPPKAAPAPSK